MVNVTIDEVLGSPCPGGYDEVVFGKPVERGAHVVLLGGDDADPPATEAEVMLRCKADGAEPEYLTEMQPQEQFHFGTTLEVGDLVKGIVFRTKHRTLHTFHGFVERFVILANGSRLCVVAYPNTPRHVPQLITYRMGGATLVYLAVRRIASSVAPTTTVLTPQHPQTKSLADDSAASWTNSGASWSAASTRSSVAPAGVPHLGSAPQALPPAQPTAAGRQQAAQNIVRGRFVVFMNEVLGTGGFGTVYKAFNQDTGDTCAAKLLYGADPASSAKALQAEAGMLEAMRHDNIVRVVGSDVETNPPALFLEWMAGGSVASLLQRLGGAPLSPAVVTRYTKQVLLGVEFLHANGVAWRDGKPHNILLGSDGTCKLSDFGLCKEIASSGSSTAGAAAGTIAYWAPECVHGQQGRPADIFAVGLVALEMGTGQAPWSSMPNLKSNPMALLFHLGTAKPPQHRPEIPATLPPLLASFIERCLVFDPHERPSATELLRDPLFGPS